MNLINKKWLKYKNKNILIKHQQEGMLINNTTNEYALIFCPKLMKKSYKSLQVSFEGEVISGEAAVLMFLNKRKEVIAETTFNSKMIVDNELIKYYLPVIKIHANTKILIKNIDFEEIENQETALYGDFTNDILVITPSYPSEEHRYLSGFVHSRIKAYKNDGINVDVAVVYDYKTISKYKFEDINVTRMGYNNLRTLLQTKKYKKILIHFFDESYFNVLEGCDLDDSDIYIWVHGPETLYWDYPKFTTKYFEKECKITEEQIMNFRKKDQIIKKYNDNENVKWIFVSEWIKNQSEKLLDIKFNNFEIIPNIIDMENFNFTKKTPDKMKKIFMLRRYDNINKYAVDVSVRTILELSKRKIFKDLEFNIYGNGDCFDELFEPIKKFNNVKFYKQFLTHKEISKVHKENGIALFPTRYDAQGVSMCEAASSGLLVISSDNDAIKEFIPYKDGNIIDTENYIAYADFIENIVNDSKKFNKIVGDSVLKIKEKCSFDATVKKEIELLNTKSNTSKKIKKVKADSNPVLTIIIPSYNVSKFVEKTLTTLIKDNNNSKYLEILVVNDGSSDNTKDVVNDFISKYCDKNNPIIKLIDKDNGGHGSTINVGIKEARGKYTRIIDGDDWVNTLDLSILIDKLKDETADIVVTDYCEDLVCWDSCDLIHKEIYEFMAEGIKYKFDDLCKENYGFKTWGPILATANIKTQKLKDANFKLSEKTFYVDMEFNSFYLPVIDDIVYYNLDIYRYYIGRANQSISLKSYVKNVDHHERVIKNILCFLKKVKISDEKNNYIYKNIVIPMVKTHYLLLIDIIRDRKKFNSFDKMLRKNLNIVDYNSMKGRVKLLRLTKGFGINVVMLLRVIKKK